jgi:alpha-beta hydrolase superfamily lysophospholipase
MLHKEAERLKETPVFLFGLSMGGGTVLEMLLHQPKNLKQEIAGIILVSPFIIASGKPSSVLLPFIKASSYIVPVFNAKEIDWTHITSLKAIQSRFENHKERFAFVPSTLGRELLLMEEELNQNISKFTHPMLILQAKDDKIVDKKGAEKLWEKSSSKDISYQEYHDCEHNIIHDHTVFLAEKRIIEWLDKKTKK